MSTSHTPSTCAEVADLLVDYAENNLPAAQQAQVQQHLQQCPACQQEVTELRELTTALQADSELEPPAQLRTQFLAMLAQEKAALPRASAAPAAGEARVVPMQPTSTASTGNWWMRIAAGLALLVTGFGLGTAWQPEAPATAVAVQEAAAPQEQRLTRALATGTAAATLTATERIQLVSDLASDSEASTAEADPVVQALINTLHFDPNTNVRLAAGQALFRLRDDPRVVPALVQSLRIQTDPNVQIMLIELLVALRERRAVPQLERLARQPEVLPEVRLQAQTGLSQLI